MVCITITKSILKQIARILKICSLAYCEFMNVTWITESERWTVKELICQCQNACFPEVGGGTGLLKHMPPDYQVWRYFRNELSKNQLVTSRMFWSHITFFAMWCRLCVQCCLWYSVRCTRNFEFVWCKFYAKHCSNLIQWYIYTRYLHAYCSNLFLWKRHWRSYWGKRCCNCISCNCMSCRDVAKVLFKKF